MKKKLTIAAALVLMLAIGVLGTLAYLTATTDTKTNTFTVGKLEASLTETKTDFKMWPGRVIDKDPTVTIKSGSEPCYVYVSVDNQVGSDAVININTTDWVQVTTSGSKTLYRYKDVVDAATADQVLPVFTKVTISSTLTNTQLSALANKNIIIKAFAHQSKETTEAVAQAAAKAALGF